MSKTIQLKDKEVSLNFREINDLDLEEILTIDYNSIKEDIQTFPFIVNQLNFLLVEARSIVNQEKFQLDILNANLKGYEAENFISVKKQLVESGEKTPTVALIENQIKTFKTHKELSEAIRCQKRKIVEAEKNEQYLNGLYWSAQSKMNMLCNLSKNIEI